MEKTQKSGLKDGKGDWFYVEPAGMRGFKYDELMFMLMTEEVKILTTSYAFVMRPKVNACGV